MGVVYVLDGCKVQLTWQVDGGEVVNRRFFTENENRLIFKDFLVSKWICLF